eukprot:CAMPEP_0182948886 /NCGR_PEP_ID=MMETSP0105_2-20130417/59983_1 /TAXON_ID=81532 ORGANISM="Acanthoeca-like sp., Strain 10tr" /NCGR_SAMPLE_ID=MMETSP0105_2 /ASSEMBLY_ACC=CAM_ASM_000205 /LENGTH=732 /DNA_ID=CAMNT_0025089181 /DNA_START=489 /DNA_END=2692 /DNA_ORIENTATION=+
MLSTSPVHAAVPSHVVVAANGLDPPSLRRSHHTLILLPTIEDHGGPITRSRCCRRVRSTVAPTSRRSHSMFLLLQTASFTAAPPHAHDAVNGGGPPSSHHTRVAANGLAPRQYSHPLTMLSTGTVYAGSINVLIAAKSLAPWWPHALYLKMLSMVAVLAVLSYAHVASNDFAPRRFHHVFFLGANDLAPRQLNRMLTPLLTVVAHGGPSNETVLLPPTTSLHGSSSVHLRCCQRSRFQRAVSSNFDSATNDRGPWRRFHHTLTLLQRARSMAALAPPVSAARLSLTILARHLPRSQNSLADSLSKQDEDAFLGAAAITPELNATDLNTTSAFVSHNASPRRGAPTDPARIRASVLSPQPDHSPELSGEGPQHFAALVNDLASQRYAANTISTYRSKMSVFVLFCQLHCLLQPATSRRHGSTQLPDVTPVLLCYYSAWLFKRGHSTFASISSYISALISWCKVRGRPDPRNTAAGERDSKYFAFAFGLKRKMGRPRPTRYPVTAWHLVQLTKAASQHFHPVLCANFVAAIRLAFSAMLRVSEFTTKGKLDVTINPTREDVVFLPTLDNAVEIKLTVKASKQDQFRETCVLTIARSDDPNRCPVRALQHLYKTDPRPPHASLFCFWTSRDQVIKQSPADQPRFRQLVHQLFSVTGISSMYLKPHSFRQGGATALLAAGAPTWIIKTLGRWRSDCWQLYAFTDPEVITHWSIKMNNRPLEAVDYDKTPPRRVCDY